MINLRTRTHSIISPTLRRGFFYALLVLMSGYPVLAVEAISASSIYIHGQTLDPDGHAIPYVSLTFTKSNILILSDGDGYYRLTSPLAEIDTITIQRIGYQTSTLPVQSLQTMREIRLTPIVLPMKSVEVRANKAVSKGALAPLTQFSKSVGSGSIDHSQLLRRIPGISIKSYGGPAGISTLSMDGGPSSHTKVLIDDIDITSAQNGEADISQLPLPFVENMSYLPYDASRNEGGSSDGIIRLGSGDQQSHLTISGGSFGHFAYDLNLMNQILGFRTSIQLGQRHESGNYGYLWDQTKRIRKNNGLNQQFAAFKFRGMLRPDLYLQISALKSQQSRGVAGLAWSPDTLSHRNDQLTLVGTTLGLILPSSTSHLRFSLRNSQENYTNPYLNLESDHRLQTYHIKVDNSIDFSKLFELYSTVSINLDKIQSNVTGRHKRLSYSASIQPGLLVSKTLKFMPSIKYQASPNLYSQVLIDLSFQVPVLWGPLEKIAVSQGEVYRYPSFNDQYWSPGGNPNLLPEETHVKTAQLQVKLYSLGGLMFQWQQKTSTNLIQWMPVHSYWQPENIQSAIRESSKVIWRLDNPTTHISAFAHLSRIYAVDKTQDKRLRYAPSRTAAGGITWSPANFEVNFQYSYVSDRISMYDYPVNTILRATQLWSTRLSYTWLTHLGGFTLVIAGDNLLDASYKTIRGYPEPGRSFRMTTTYTPLHKYERK